MGSPDEARSDSIVADQFARKALQTERVRLLAIACFAVVGLVAYTALVTLRRTQLESLFDRDLPLWLPPLLLVSLFAYAALVRAWISRVQAAGLLPRLWLAYAIALVEATIPTAFVGVLCTVVDPLQALLAAPVWLYFLVVGLSVLRLDPALSLFTGVVAGLQYAAVAVVALWVTETAVTVPLLRTPAQHTFKAALLVLSGGVAAYAARHIRVRITESLRLVAARDAALRDAKHAAELALAATAAKSTFLANMSHELRTPLNAIIGYSELVSEELAADGRTALVEDLDKVQRAGSHLLQLISDVLDLSKIEAGHVEIAPTRFELSGLLEDVIETVAPAAIRNGTALVTDLEEVRGTAPVHGDDVRIRQVLLNLLGNAAKFTQDGEVRLSAARLGPERWRFEVVDTGIGMSEAQVSRVFEPFVQADATTTRQFGGTGLGLAITRSLVEMLGGVLEVRSELGRGSTFAVELPLPPSEVEAAPRAPVASRPGCVLVVEDDPSSRELLRRCLEGAGYQVATVADGLEVVERARELRPVAITLDVMLPGQSGWAVLRALKGDPQLSRIPVVLATFLHQRQLGFALGASAYLSKPIDRDALVEALSEAVVERSAPVLIVEDDADAREVLARTLAAKGWAVDTAADGIQAIERVEAQAPSAVVLDLMMPRMDGFGVLRHLRSDPRFQEIPVVVVTATVLTRVERDALFEGAQQVLSKAEHTAADVLREVDRLVMGRDPQGLTRSRSQ